MNERRKEWVNEWMNEWTNEWNHWFNSFPIPMFIDVLQMSSGQKPERNLFKWGLSSEDIRPKCKVTKDDIHAFIECLFVCLFACLFEFY